MLEQSPGSAAGRKFRWQSPTLWADTMTVELPTKSRVLIIVVVVIVQSLRRMEKMPRIQKEECLGQTGRSRTLRLYTFWGRPRILGQCQVRAAGRY